MRRILLGHLAANGDCLYATILARQIRHDHPAARITWAISSQCAGLLRNNPHVDEIWEVPLPHRDKLYGVWQSFEREATRRLLRHEFDHAYLTQIWPNNFQNYDGTVRPSILRSYGAPITVPIENIIVLDEQEQANIERFAAQSGLAGFTHRILFECSVNSSQSFVTPELAQQIAQHLYVLLPSACVVFSTNLPMQLQHASSRYAGTLSLSELAGLTQHCTLFVGAGSGGSVAATSTAARPLPMLQLLSASRSVFASLAHDFFYFGLPHRHILEMTRQEPRTIAAAIAHMCNEGVESAREKYGESIPLRFEHYAEFIDVYLLRHDRYIDAAQSLTITAQRYGWLPQLRQFGEHAIAPRLASDPGWMYPHRRRQGEEFLARLHQSRRDWLQHETRSHDTASHAWQNPR